MEVRSGSSREYFLRLILSRSSEGVQIGGQCSAAGIVGAWSGAQHAEGRSFYAPSFANVTTHRPALLLPGDPQGWWHFASARAIELIFILQVHSGSSGARRHPRPPEMRTGVSSLFLLATLVSPTDCGRLEQSIVTITSCMSLDCFISGSLTTLLCVKYM